MRMESGQRQEKGQDVTAPRCGGGGGYSCVGEHSQRQGHLEGSRVHLTLSHLRSGGGEGSEEDQVQQPGGSKGRQEGLGNQNVQTK